MGWFSEFGSLNGTAPLNVSPSGPGGGLMGETVGGGAPVSYGGGVLNFSNGLSLAGIESAGTGTRTITGDNPSVPASDSTYYYVEKSRPDIHSVIYWKIPKNQTVDYLWAKNYTFSVSNPATKPTISQVLNSTFYQLIDWTKKLGVHGSQVGDNITFNDKGSFIHGWRGSDTITGGAGKDDVWEGARPGDRNIIDLKGGVDGINYSFVWEVKTNESGVVINGGFDGGGLGDTITNVEHITATELDDSIFVPTGNAPDEFGMETHTSGDAGNDKIRGNGQRNEIFGGTGSDTLYGGDGNDVIFGNIQFHTAGGEYDEIDGGKGNDWLYADLEGSGSIRGGEGDDTIFGGESHDTLLGEAGDDRIQGFSETSTPTADADTLEGGAGNDTLIGADGDDSMDGGDDIDELYGNGGKDTIVGGAASDLLSGGADDDSLVGGSGIDLLLGGAGADRLDGGEDRDIAVYTGATPVHLALPGATNSSSGDAAGDQLVDVEVIVGSDGNDDIDLGTSRIEVYGAGGADVVIGSDQNDTIYGDFGAGGLDFVMTLLSARGIPAGGASGNDTLYGGAGGDTLYGGAADDMLFGDIGADSLVGGDGDDILTGGAEGPTLASDDSASDTLDGGAGEDIFIVGNGDVIKSVNVGDAIVLAAVLETKRASIVFDGDKTYFYLDEGGASPLQVAVLEQGIAAARFSASIVHGLYDGLYAEVKSTPLSNTQAFATSSLDAAKSLSDFQVSWNTILKTAFTATAEDAAEFGVDKLGDAFERQMIRLIADDFASRRLLLEFSEKLSIALPVTEFLSGAAALIVSELRGEFRGSDLDRAMLWGELFNDVFNPLPGTSKAALMVGDAVLKSLIDQMITSFAAPIVAIGKMLSAGTNGDDSYDSTNTDQPDFVELGDGNDTVRTGGGDDVVVGGSGRGNDDYDGGAGRDTLVYSSTRKGIVVDLSKGKANGVEIDHDLLAGFENVVGGTGADRITGNKAANVLDGAKGNDSLAGGKGKDTLSGGLGQDSLTGGDKADTFVFDVKPGGKHADIITDFRHNTDIIGLDDLVFAAIGPKLEAKEFYAAAGATRAHDRDDRIVYDTRTGKLYYDDDGNKAGGHAAVLFATLSNKPPLDHGDFAIV